ncbi:MAG: hypothetical protein ACTHNT_01395, partial [Actinomycetales bacterium]
MRRLISRPLALLGSALMIVGVASVAAPAGADAGKDYTATVGPSAIAVGYPHPVNITLTNVDPGHTLGAVRATFPTDGTGVIAGWNSPGCTIVRSANSSLPSGDCASLWTLTSSPGSGALTVTAETASSTNAALRDGDAIVLTATPTYSSDNLSSSSRVDLAVITVAKQSNTFNDVRSGNEFALSGPSPVLSILPSAQCKDENPCTLKIDDDKALSRLVVTNDATNDSSTQTNIVLDGAVLQCAGASGRTVATVDDIADGKSVELSWTSDYTAASGISSKKWPVCMQAPYDLYDQASRGIVRGADGALAQAQLPDCGSKAVRNYPCVSDRSRVAGEQRIVVSVP